MRTFLPVPGIRDHVPLLIGVSGPPGGGKTFSALLLAQGIKQHRGGDIFVVDTESNRALAYAPRKGEKPDGRNTFDFIHVPFAPPFPPDDFLAVIRQLVASKPAAIIIDSASDEHEGEGGVLELHDNYKGGDLAHSQAGWNFAKAGRKRLINGILQTMTPIIFCFRAREKVKPITNSHGKTVPTNIGWTPIAPAEIVHSMTLFCLLPIRSDGVPMWKGNTAYEDFSIKLPRQFEGICQEGKPLDAAMGYAMSQWAMGDTAPVKDDPADTYSKVLKRELRKPETLALWWAETSETRMALNVPAERLETWTLAVQKVLNPEDV